MKKLLTLGCTLLFATTAFAQRDEFGTWLEVEAEKKINKRIDLTLGLGMRANDNLGEVSRANALVSGSYKVCDYLKVAATYQYISDLSRGDVKEDFKKSNGKFNGYNVDEAFHRTKHRLSFDLSSKVKVGRFTFSLRERYQFTHSMNKDIERVRYREEVPAGFDYSTPVHPFGGYEWFEAEVGEDHKNHKNNHLLRSRIGVEYDIKKCPLTPFATYEIKTQLQKGGATEETRLIVGTDWKLNKKNTLSIAYVFNDAHYSDDANVHALSIGYKFKF
jgi:hypothetical protein